MPDRRRPLFFLPLLLAAVICSASEPLRAAETVLLDTFDDDTAGQPPAGPEVGTYYGGNFGTHSVLEVAGEKWMRSTCTAPGGFQFKWLPSEATTGSVRISYRLRIESGGSLSAANALNQSVNMRKADNYVVTNTLSWGNDLQWRVNQGSPLGVFSLDTDYDVVWDFDVQSDVFDLAIGGVQLVAGQAIGGDATWLSDFLVDCNFGTSASQRVDGLRAVQRVVFEDGFERAALAAWTELEPDLLVGDECVTPGALPQGIDVPDSLFDHTENGGFESGCSLGDRIDRWLEYTAQCTGTATITTCLPGTEFDTVLSAYDTCGGTEIACNDDADGSPSECDLSGENRKSTMSFPVTAGTHYPIRVSVWNDGFPAADATEFEIRVECAP